MEGFSFRKRIRSFGFAFKGLFYLIRTQHNVWIHLAAAVVVIALGVMFNLRLREWMWIALAIGFVFTAELFNTAVEQLVDLISPEHSEKAGRIKDLAAGAVLVAAVTALVIGIGIFLPRLL